MKAGFEGAPLSLIIFISTLTLSLISYFGFLGKDTLILNEEWYKHPWCIITSLFCHSSISQIIYSLLLIYTFRILERRWSTRIFLQRHILINVISLLLSVFIFRFTHKFYSLQTSHTVFIIYYYLEVLPLIKLKIFMLETSDNFFVYFSYIMMLFNNFKDGIFFTLIGLIAALISLYPPIYSVFPSLPHSINSMIDSFFDYIDKIQTPFTFIQNNKPQRRQIEGEFMQAMRENINPINEQPTQQTRDQKIQTIMDCGFTREQATFALNNTNGNVENALAFLLDNGNY
ncbi:hypothetical protein ENUP19_0305G0065 [Entamoeba nuttalli]|uniref:UBA/TS-N domain containing protein n=2 Tax=Entamoeba nuttalli TaxID=412467 RepID=K2HCH0_ENTNP|nr:UBA/TS-N domain containing protein [Entamoeba nuttalli P19]EKE40434.1 UBA/TS-N domain containing protein [Entamoeba nuttalli P19]|eukprot:XP_008857220.1 UBA/TS-N domain containing protein [Entamoeba nuttalli P19]